MQGWGDGARTCTTCKVNQLMFVPPQSTNNSRQYTSDVTQNICSYQEK